MGATESKAVKSMIKCSYALLTLLTRIGTAVQNAIPYLI